jgi:hypothetical protein
MGAEALEPQQALLLALLRRAGGRPVSYAELRDAGIELPASVASELELAGVPVERCHEGPRGRRGAMGVRLDPARDPAAAGVGEVGGAEKRSASPAPRVHPERATSSAGLPPASRAPGPRRLAAPGWTSEVVDVARRTAGNAIRALRADRRRLLATLALLAALGAVATLVVISLAEGGGGARHAAAGRHPAKPSRAASALAAGGQAPPTIPAHPPPAVGKQPTARSARPTPVSEALATELEARGHGLLESGRYADAAPVLRRALAATGERLGACLEPASGNCLTYAYALYDLGRALRLSGDAAAAVPILERRLQIDNQRPTVEAELELARQEAG